MRSAREFGNALVAAFLSIGLTLGALSISLVGFIPDEAEPPTFTSIPSPIPVTATFTLPPSPTLPQTGDTATFTVTNTIAVAQQSTLCPSPAGWTIYIVQAGDTLATIASRYGINAEFLKSSNCLLSNELLPGKSIYVPNLPTSTSVACIPGSPGWVNNYVVKPGDTFYGIAYRYYTTEREIKRVNCRSTNDLYSGETIWVPSNTPRPLTSTPIPITPTVDNSTATPVFTEPGTMLPFTLTPSLTLPPVPTFTVSPIPTQTASLTPFPELTPNP